MPILCVVLRMQERGLLCLLPSQRERGAGWNPSAAAEEHPAPKISGRCAATFAAAECASARAHECGDLDLK